MIYYAYQAEPKTVEFHNINNICHGLWRNNKITGIGTINPTLPFIEEETYYKCDDIVELTNIMTIPEFIATNKSLFNNNHILSFLAYACQQNLLDIVESLISSEILNKEVFRSKNNYALQDACQDGNFNIIKNLIDNNIIDYEDFKPNEYIYPLRTLFLYNHLNIIKYLHKYC